MLLLLWGRIFLCQLKLSTWEISFLEKKRATGTWEGLPSICKALIWMKHVCIPCQKWRNKWQFLFPVTLLVYPTHKGTDSRPLKGKHFFMVHVCWTYEILTLTAYTTWFFFLFIFFNSKFLSISTFQKNFTRITNKNRKLDISIIFLIIVCSRIQNTVGTGSLNTTALIRGLSFYFIKFYIFLCISKSRDFSAKKNSVR